MRKRYFTILTNLGAVVIDRRAATWTLYNRYGQMADWGALRARPDLLAHLQAHARKAQLAYDCGQLTDSD
jgi:hypothetical protein